MSQFDAFRRKVIGYDDYASTRFDRIEGADSSSATLPQSPRPPPSGHDARKRPKSSAAQVIAARGGLAAAIAGLGALYIAFVTMAPPVESLEMKQENRQLTDQLTMEEQDALAIARLGEAGADLEAPRTIRHFLYVPNRESAAAIADELRHRRFRIELKPGVDANWLVLASHEAILSVATLASTRHSMEAAIVKFGAGAYDGWEAEVRPYKGHAKPN